jgi:hypothetical protein
MTEFNASQPVGAIRVEVQLDRTPYNRALAALRQETQRGVGAPQMTMAPTTQQLYGGAWGGGGGFGRPQWMGAPGAAGAPAGGPQMAPGGGWVFNPPAAATPNPRQPRQPAQPQPHNPWTSPISFTTGGHGGIASLYGVVRIAESLMQLGDAAIQTTRAMRFAHNNAEMIAADIQGYKANHSALSQIPLFGPLASTGRQLFDTMMGNSPEDVMRNQLEAQRISDLYDASTSGRMRAFAGSAAASAAMSPAGNLNAELAANAARFRSQQVGFGIKRDEINRNIGSTSVENEAGFLGHFMRKDVRQYFYGAQADQRNAELAQQRGVAMGAVNAEEAAAKKEKEASDHKLQFASDQLRLQMDTQNEVAQLTLKQRYSESQTAEKWGQFFHQLNATPDQLKGKFFGTSFNQALAQRQQMIIDGGRTMATSVDSTRDIIGDPSNLRKVVDPIEGLNGYLRSLFAYGVTVMTR